MPQHGIQFDGLIAAAEPPGVASTRLSLNPTTHAPSPPATHPSSRMPIPHHSRPSPNVIPSEVEESKPFMHNPHLPKRPPVRQSLPRSGTCCHSRHVLHTVVPGKSRNPSHCLSAENRNPPIGLSGDGRNLGARRGRQTHVGLPDKTEPRKSISSSPDNPSDSPVGFATGAAPT